MEDNGREIVNTNKKINVNKGNKEDKKKKGNEENVGFIKKSDMPP